MTDRYGAAERFEVDSANAARTFLKERGIAAPQAQLVWDSIALHTTRSIALHKEPEVVMTHSGIAADVIGAGLDLIPQEKARAILSEFPRLAMKKEFRDCLSGIVRRKPATTYDNVLRDIGMLVTGPWDLSAFPNVKYGVQVMPSYPGTSGGHQTISGPDNWVIFNNSPARVAAAEQFLLWLTAPAQVKYFAVQTGNLPTRQSVGDSAAVSQQMNASLPGVGAFVANLANVKQARPQIPQYPKISTILGTMIVSVLLGKSQPQAALTAAAQQVDQALAAG
jgi:hypothetical protein